MLTMIMAGKAYDNWIDVQHCAFFSLTQAQLGGYLHAQAAFPLRESSFLVPGR